MSRPAGATGQPGSKGRRYPSVHTPGPMALVWITVARGVMAIILGVALAASSSPTDRAGASVPECHWGILEIGLGTTFILTADRHDSLSTWLASTWALLGGAGLVSDALRIRRRLLAHPDTPARSP